ncbi:Ni/Fe-hydrogenase, b-type cytochrome subunit [Geobacter sp. SVR]|uniref:Ni/Fe-hydrogenase, b-type cytochrome subunit n=1 Tax=Geobacter sp. SVR TaxID=2495594 RepID=UPI00143F01CA|nr:Ni/Fe-hydrogenase, b-type cytochrome subunit [Geobacter sp. SVR]BCS52235.1 Ni/Fe-hydrogenase, b-type cytochrome subunit [Geobacter sp. SVR]GCF85104.1 Ni/Fe-hydrogenase, b-type cytochrome subunit [Geobacter sp. SVR]
MANDLRQEYVWEVPVRVTHWVNFLAIIVLSVTGLYIGSPLTLTVDPTRFYMGTIRFIHTTTAYIFTISVFARIYWAFVGNRYAGWREFVPWYSPEGRRNMALTLRYYMFVDRQVPNVVGHNALAGATYLLVFLLYLVMIVTGFALYSQSAPDGVFQHLLGWLFRLFTNQGMRLVHHMGMWFLIAFAIHHVYSAWLMDVKERGGTMSSIFGGYKPVRR